MHDQLISLAYDCGITDTDKRPPLKQIADLLSISKMTVSRALREGTPVEARLRAKIHETARKIGYQPDSRISQVMSAIRRSQAPHYRETLAFVWTHRRNDKGCSSYFYDAIFSGANLRANQLGYKLDEIRITDEAMNGRSLSHILHARGIRGVLVAPPSAERTHPHIWLDWKKFACVLIGRSFANVGIARVQPDHYLACVQTLRRLKRLRYQRIGLVLSHSMDERSVRMIRSAFQSFHPLGLTESKKLIFTSENHDPKILAKWMEQQKPDVLLANFEDPFPRPEQLACNGKVKVDLVALNWSKHQPGLAGIDQQLPLIGEHAVDMVRLHLQRNQFGLQKTMPTINVPGTWVNGPSIRQTAPCKSVSKQEGRKSTPAARAAARCG